jgi:aryl-alcohol dehydrogenase-like predicted oxidoreductase
MKSKLCLGTVKVGVPSYGYSITNRSDDHNTLFLRATEIGITSFDTSPRYANSENIVGRFVEKYRKKLFISTKIDSLNINNNRVIYKMRESVLRSIENLNIEFLDLCYLHQNELSIISNKYILDGLNKLKQEGLINNIGASVYSVEELDYILKSNNFDWVQIPVNILDTSFYNRIVESDSTIKIAARSIFLQGIMFNTEAIKNYIPDADEIIILLERIKLLGRSYNLKLIDLAIAYVCSLQSISQVIVGTTNVKNLNQAECSSKILLNKEITGFLDKISKINKPWTNPRMWDDNF